MTSNNQKAAGTQKRHKPAWVSFSRRRHLRLNPNGALQQEAYSSLLVVVPYNLLTPLALTRIAHCSFF